jgi:hypothetical protein
MGVKHVEAFIDLLLVVQQVAGVFQYFDGLLNAYLDKCLKTITLFDDFTMQHVSRDENTVANDLAQRAPSFRSNQGKIGFLEKLNFLVCQTGWSGFQPMHSTTIYSGEASLVKLNGPFSKTRGSKIFKNSNESSKTMTVDPVDWRTPLIRYLENPGHIVDRKV